MHRRPARSTLRPTALLLLLAATACGDPPVAADPNRRKIDWTYGPTTGGATTEHVRGTGKEGGKAIAKGWQCWLLDGKRLTVQPYELAASHPLFGKVTMGIGLFDKNGKELAMLASPPLAAGAATFTFEIAEDTAKQLLDVVIWFRKA
jgi:hypothetical protein